MAKWFLERRRRLLLHGKQEHSAFLRLFLRAAFSGVLREGLFFKLAPKRGLKRNRVGGGNRLQPASFQDFGLFVNGVNPIEPVERRSDPL